MPTTPTDEDINEARALFARDTAAAQRGLTDLQSLGANSRTMRGRAEMKRRLFRRGRFGSR